MDDFYNTILNNISSILSARLEVIKFTTNTITSNYFIAHIIEKKQLNISYFYKQSSRGFENCGDSLKILNNDDKLYACISDGMGNGNEASEEASFTIDLLFNSITSDINPFESIQISNSLLKLKNNYDTFTTVDLLTINKLSMIARFYKAGATASFIIREKDVIVIDNYTLPLGIVDEINPLSINIKLQENDIILLMSDGLMDVYDDAIKHTLENLDIADDCIFICKELFDKLISRSHKYDDASLIVIKITK